MNTKTLTLAILFLLMASANTQAATYEIISDSLWSELSPTPTLSDDIIVKNGATLTLDVSSAVCKSMFLGYGGTNAGDGELYFNSSTSSITIAGTSGMLQVSGGRTGTLDMTNGGTLSLEDVNNVGNLVFIRGSGLVVFTNTKPELLPAILDTFNNLAMTGSSSLTLMGDIVVEGEFWVNSGTFSTGGASNSVLTEGEFIVGASGIIDPRFSAFTLEGNVMIYGTFQPDSAEIILAGTNQTWEGEGEISYLQMNSIGETRMRTNMNVRNRFKLTSGILNVSQDTLTLSDDCVINGSPGIASHIRADSAGIVRQRMTATGSIMFPVGDGGGYTPATFNYTSGTFNAGAFVGVNIDDAVHAQNFSPYNRLSRIWNTVDSGITSYSSTVSFVYDDADIIGTEANINLVRYASGVWDIYSDVTAATNTGLATISDVNGEWTGGGTTILPISLIRFDAEVETGGVMLNWETIVEENSRHFVVERSSEGMIFDSIGVEKAIGATTTGMEYMWKDYDAPGGTVYYRLKCEDKDGSNVYSNIVSVYHSYSKEELVDVRLRSNLILVGNVLEIELNNRMQENIDGRFIIHDINGRIVFDERIRGVKQGNSVIGVNELLSSGTYFLNAKLGKEDTTQRFVVSK